MGYRDQKGNAEAIRARYKGLRDSMNTMTKTTLASAGAFNEKAKKDAEEVRKNVAGGETQYNKEYLSTLEKVNKLTGSFEDDADSVGLARQVKESLINLGDELGKEIKDLGTSATKAQINDLTNSAILKVRSLRTDIENIDAARILWEQNKGKKPGQDGYILPSPEMVPLMQIFQASEDGTRNIFLLPDNAGVDGGWNLVLTNKTKRDSTGKILDPTAADAGDLYDVHNVFNTSDFSKKVAKDGEIFKTHEALDWKGLGDQIDNYLKENDATLSQTHPNLYSTPPVYKKTRTGGKTQMVGGVVDKAELVKLLEGPEFQDYFEDITSEDAAPGQWYAMGDTWNLSSAQPIAYDIQGNIVSPEIPDPNNPSQMIPNPAIVSKKINKTKALGVRQEGEEWDRNLMDYDPAEYKQDLITKIASKYF